MAEIKIVLTEIDKSIKNLQILQSKFKSVQKNALNTVGGGKTVNELEAIAAQYKTVNSSLDVLLSNTISFLLNLRASYVGSDQKAAKGINGKA